MTKPFEETWEAVGDRVALVVEPGQSWVVFAMQTAGPGENGRAKLAAHAPELARMLLARELDACDRNGGNECSDCGTGTPGDHRDDCAWLDLMKRCGAR